MSIPPVIGRHRVETIVGVGGFGSVVRAHDEELSSTVAVKILADNWAADPDIRDRFLAEARHLRRIHNPHVVTVYDIGDLEDGRPYFVMEYADRGTLAERLATRPRDLALDPPSIARLLTALADGVAAIHSAGLVHRDLNPRNLLICSDHPERAVSDRTSGTVIRRAFLADDERLVVGDLGLAKDLLSSDPAASVLGGSPHYRAPEQMDAAGGVTMAADVYALTAMLWRLLTGDVPPEPHLVTVDALERADARWRPMLRRGMSPDPEARFGSVTEWRDAALDALGHTDGSSTRAAAGSGTAAVVGDRCPYRGLASYQLEDAADFFGREGLVSVLVERMRDCRTLVVAGPSGSGKSSVVRAGLLRSLGAGALPGSDRWPVALMTPGTDPLAELQYQLVRIATSLLGDRPSGEGASRPDPQAARLLADAITDQAGGLVLCIDQFEELFTLGASPADRTALIDVLAALVDPTASHVRLVLAMRADFYAQAALEPWLAQRITDNQVLVGPMDRAELRRAIEGPAHRAGLVDEEGLVDAILDEAGAEVGSLPLVSHALVETWRRRANGRLTLDGYHDAGGVSGAIAQTAEALHHKLDQPSRKRMENLFLRLVNPGEGTADTRRHVALDQIDAGDEMAVVEQLVDARLVTAGVDHIEVAHEALLSNWPRLRGWIEDSRADLRLRQHIGRAAAEWCDRDEDPDLLYRGSPLNDAIAWRSQRAAQLGPTERRFLDVSEAVTAEAAAQEAQRERRSRRVRRFAAAAAIGIVVAAAIGVASVARVRSDERASAAEERIDESLGIVARLSADNDPYLALGLGAEARMRTSGPAADAWTAVVTSRQQLADARLIPVGEPIRVGRALTVAISPDGAIGAVGLDDGTLRLVDTQTGRFVSESRRHENGIEEISFSHDGQRLATAGLDGRVLVWDLASLRGGADVAPTEVQLGQLGWSVDWSPDGTTLATASEDGVVQLWDARTGQPEGTPLVDSEFDMLTVAFSPAGDQLIAADGLGELWAWELPSRTLQYSEVDAHAGSDIWELSFTADGTRVLTASSDRSATMRDAATGALVDRLFVGPGGEQLIGDVRGVVAWDDTTVLGGTDRGQISVFDLEQQRIVAMAGPDVSARILDAAYSSESGRILAVANDDTLRRFQIDRQWPLSTPIDGFDGGAYGAAFLSDGSVLAVGDGTGGVVLADAQTGMKIERLDLGLSGRVWGLDAAPNRDLLAAGDDSGTVVLAERDEVLRTLDGHEGQIADVRFAPGGELLATGGRNDGRLKIWRVEDGTMIADVSTGAIGALAWLPGGDAVLVTDLEGHAVVVNTDGSIRSGPRSVEGDIVWAAAVDPDARLVAFGTAADSVTIWNSDLTGDQLAAVTQLDGDGVATEFVDGGRLLVSLSRQGSVRLWNPTTADAVGEAMPGHDGDSWSLAIHPDDRHFATTGTDGTVQLWDVLALDRACAIALEFVDVDQPRILGDGGRLDGCVSLARD